MKTSLKKSTDLCSKATKMVGTTKLKQDDSETRSSDEQKKSRFSGMSKDLELIPHLSIPGYKLYG